MMIPFVYFASKMRALIITPLLVFACAAAEDAPPLTTLTINNAEVRVEIAATPQTRRTGFSHRPPPPPNTGILFVWPQAQQFCLWMRDVSFPLDAAFIDATGTIIGIARMHPHTETIHCPPSPAQYALEVNAGWMQEHTVHIGNSISGLP